MPDFGNNPFSGPAQQSAVPLPNIEALITKLGINQAQQVMSGQRTIINDLDELFSEMTTDQRKTVEANEEYVIALGTLLQKYLLFSLGHTPEGIQFISTHGKKLAQNLLDTAKSVASTVSKNERNELQGMNDRIQQLESIIQQQAMLSKTQSDKIVELEKLKTSLGGD